MKKNRKAVSKNEMMKGKWKRQIMLEKDYTEQCSEWMAERLEALLDHMQYGHATVAYRKQNGSFQLVKATLIYYEAEFRKKYDPTKIEGAVVYWNVDEQRWTTFQVENFMEENAMEVIEAKYGMKGLAIVLKLLCKIYKEGYYIPWGEEQCLIFANKTGKEADAEEVQGIIEIMIEKGMIDRGSYAEHKVLTSEAIQKVWIEATKRRKRNWTAMPYLLIKPKETCNEEKTVCTQNVEQDAGSDAKNACNTEQSKVKQSREFPPSAPPRGKEEEVNATPVSMPGYAFNTMTHNYVGLMGNLERFGITDEKEIEAILRLSDYGRKGTPVWKLICSTNWSNIGAKGKYMIAALNRAKKRSGT